MLPLLSQVVFFFFFYTQLQDPLKNKNCLVIYGLHIDTLVHARTCDVTIAHTYIAMAVLK